MWECRFKQLKLNIPQTYYTPTESLVRLTKRQILEAIEDDLLFGLITCDLHVPDHLKTYFEELTPIFKNVDVTMGDIGPTMQEYCQNNNCTFKGWY